MGPRIRHGRGLHDERLSGNDTIVARRLFAVARLPSAGPRRAVPLRRSRLRQRSRRDDRRRHQSVCRRLGFRLQSHPYRKCPRTGGPRRPANVHFEEISFEALANSDTSAAGDDFDIMVAHGILSWISLREPAASGGRHRAPAAARGLTYMSYNVAAGWPGCTDPIADASARETDQRRTDLAVGRGFQVLDQLKDAGAAFFRAYPGAGSPAGADESAGAPLSGA